MNKCDLVFKIRGIMDGKCEDPSDELVKLGEAIVAIGKALKGQSPGDARAIIEAVSALETGVVRRQ